MLTQQAAGVLTAVAFAGAAFGAPLKSEIEERVKALLARMTVDRNRLR